MENEKLCHLRQGKQDNGRRFIQVRNDPENNNKRENMYDSYLYQPNYGKSFTTQLTNEISLNENP